MQRNNMVTQLPSVIKILQGVNLVKRRPLSSDQHDLIVDELKACAGSEDACDNCPHYTTCITRFDSICEKEVAGITKRSEPLTS